MSLRCTLLLLLLIAGCSSKADSGGKRTSKPAIQPTKAALALSPDEQKQAGIEVHAAVALDVAATITLNGTLLANQERIATVAPRLPGRIVTAPVPLGAAVSSGQVLATIESIELGEAQAAYRQARSEANVAETTLARAEKLAADEIIAGKDLQRARADDEHTRATLRAAADKLRLLGVAPGDKRDAMYPLTAPFAGNLIEKRAVPGAQVNTDPLFTMADLSTVWLEADVFERDLQHVKTGSSAAVTVAAYPERVFAGQLTYLSATMDTASRTVKARIELPNPDAALKPGMFATARLEIGTTRAVALPAAAVTLLADQPTVFVLTPQGFQPRTVEIVTRADNRVEIRAGLQPGENVAVAGAYALKSRLLKSSLTQDD